MNFYPNDNMGGYIPNMVNNGMNYMNDIFNKFNQFEDRIKKLEQRVMKLENNSNKNNYMEPNNSLYML